VFSLDELGIFQIQTQTKPREIEEEIHHQFFQCNGAYFLWKHLKESPIGPESPSPTLMAWSSAREDSLSSAQRHVVFGHPKQNSTVSVGSVLK
jgi:hypothetical protein